MRNVLLSALLFILLQCNGYSQVIRYNINESSIGIQTPHDWNIYGHCEFRLFSMLFSNGTNINAYHTQAGYTWLNESRATIRSAIDFTYWFLIPNTNRTQYHYWGITPIAFTIYPFYKDYLGIDLYTNFDPYDITVSGGATLVVRIK